MKPFKHIVGASAWIAAIFVGLLLVSCGGSGGGAAGPGDSDFATRQAIMNRAISDASSLTFANFEALAPAVAATIRSRNEFKSVTIDPDGQQVIWAEFADGRLLAISRSRGPREAPRSRQSTRDGESPGFGLPPVGKAAFFCSFIDEPLATNVASELEVAAQAAGYQLHSGKTGTLDDYKSLSDVGMLYIDSHGVLERGKVSIQTGSIVTAELDELYEAELKSKELFYQSGLEGEDVRSPQYSFSSDWARKNIKLAPGAFVFANTCNSQANTTLSDALKDGGMVAMIGWNRPVMDDDVAASARFFYDHAFGEARLYNYGTGDTAIAKPSVPVEWTEIVNTMRDTIRPQETFSFAESDLSFGDTIRIHRLISSGTSFTLGTFRPLIKNLASNELENLIALSGIFGQEVGTVSAMTDGGRVNVPVTSWSFNSIAVPFNPEWNSFQVTVNGVTGNEMEFALRQYELSSQTGGAITLRDEITLSVSGKVVYDGPSVNQGPIRFQGKPGGRLRIQVRRNAPSSASVSAYLNSPITPRYIVVPATILNFNPNTTGLIYDQAFFLQP